LTSTPTGDPSVTLDPLPQDGGLVPRDVPSNLGVVVVSGTSSAAGWGEVLVHVINGGNEEAAKRSESLRRRCPRRRP
jgi:hypothetical protein